MENYRDSEYIQIIVVDDEMIGADDVSELIQERFGEAQKVVTRTAYNARTVLKMAAETPCDILVTDIQMPMMDGLALAREMRRLYGDIAILFLTGFDDFAYAYEAFKYNAERYLLKTDGDDEILRAVGEAIARVREQRQILQKIFDAENRYNQMLPVYRRQVVLQLLTENADEAGAAEAGVDGDRLYVVVARIGQTADASMRLKLIAASAISQIVENALDGALKWSNNYVIDGELAWVFSLSGEGAPASALFHLMRQARRHVEEQLRLPLFFVVADRDVGWQELSDKYHEIRAALVRDILQGSTGVAIYNPAIDAERFSEARVRQMNRLRYALEACQRDLKNGGFDALSGHAAPILDYVRGAPSASDAFAAELVSTLNGSLLNYLNRNGLSRVAADCERIRHLGESDYLETLIGQIERQSTAHRDNAIKSVAEYVCGYIRDHVSEDISTTVLTEVTGYSSGYLSRVFRQEYGVSIHEFVTRTRMDLAKELLTNTNLRVYEIANHCGYENSTYFIKVFRTYTGVTPQEYKQSTAPSWKH